MTSNDILSYCYTNDLAKEIRLHCRDWYNRKLYSYWSTANKLVTESVEIHGEKFEEIIVYDENLRFYCTLVYTSSNNCSDKDCIDLKRNIKVGKMGYKGYGYHYLYVNYPRLQFLVCIK
jgi:hypothetical protein